MFKSVLPQPFDSNSYSCRQVQYCWYIQLLDTKVEGYMPSAMSIPFSLSPLDVNQNSDLYLFSAASGTQPVCTNINSFVCHTQAIEIDFGGFVRQKDLLQLRTSTWHSRCFWQITNVKSVGRRLLRLRGASVLSITYYILSECMSAYFLRTHKYYWDRATKTAMKIYCMNSSIWTVAFPFAHQNSTKKRRETRIRVISDLHFDSHSLQVEAVET